MPENLFSIDQGRVTKRDTFLAHLNQPFGMLVLGNYFYVANTDGVWRYPYKTGQEKITGPAASWQAIKLSLCRSRTDDPPAPLKTS
jgi:glucose/arabinose dehydrogenase